MITGVPPARAPIAGSETVTREWYRFFQTLQVNVTDATVSDEVDALTVRVTSLEDEDHTIPPIRIMGVGSIYVTATDIKVVSLQGDTDDPGLTTYYGSDATGAKGWFPVSSALHDSANVSLTVDADGVTTFDLTTLADAGGGALLRVVRDDWGRITGTSAATLDDISDVDAPTPADEQVLTFNVITGKWEAKTPSGGGSDGVFPIVTGEVPPVFAYCDDGSLVYGEIH